MRSRRPWCFSRPTTAATSRERNCLWMAVLRKCRRWTFFDNRQTIKIMSAKRLSGKVAVVTGASKGIGAAIAKQLAAEGAAVVVNYSSSKTGADKVLGEIASQGGKAIVLQANLSNQADIERLFADTKEAFGRLDILVNNAGIYEFSPLESLTEEHFHKHFNLNVLGLLLASHPRAHQPDRHSRRVRRPVRDAHKEATRRLDGALLGDHRGNERDRVLLPVSWPHAGHCGRHHIAGAAGGGDLRAVRASPRRRVAQDLCDQHGARSLSECVLLGRPVLLEDTGVERNCSDSERAALQAHATRGIGRVHSARHFRRDQIPA